MHKKRRRASMEKYEKPTMDVQIFDSIKTLVEISGSEGKPISDPNF